MNTYIMMNFVIWIHHDIITTIKVLSITSKDFLAFFLLFQLLLKYISVQCSISFRYIT